MLNVVILGRMIYRLTDLNFWFPAGVLCCEIFIHCVKVHCCDRCDKKLNEQPTARQEVWAGLLDRTLREEGSLVSQMQRKSGGQ